MEEVAVNVDEIRTRLTGVFHKALGAVGPLRDDMKPGDIPDWDSVAHVTIIMAIEKEFKVKFKGAEIADAVTVANLVEKIRAKLSAG
jgi:acyl carrier protein